MNINIKSGYYQQIKMLKNNHFFDFKICRIILNFYKITVQKRKIRYNAFQKRYAQKYSFKGFVHGIYFVKY